MYDRDALAKELSHDEARRSVLYHDSEGILTGGVGHNFEAQPTPDDVLALLPDGWVAQLGATLTDAAIDLLLSHDIDAAQRALDHFYPKWTSLDDARQQVLMDLTFNMGIHTFSGFHKFWAAVDAGDWDEAIAQLKDSKWYGQVGDHRAGPLFAMLGSGEVTA